MALKLVTRAQWGARSSSLPTNITPQHGGVTMHYVGSTQVHDSHAGCAGRVRGIQNHHIDGNGWNDIAYTLLICQHGYVYVGRGVHRRTAANGTNAGNQNWYAICFLVGGSQAPSGVAVQAGRDAVAYLRAQGGAGSEVNGHRDHLSTWCPGTPVYALVQDGTFTRTSGNTTTEGDEEMLGLKQGDSGPAVRALQTSLRHAGFESIVGAVDGDYGPATAAAVLACRQWVHSSATSGASVTGEAAAQIRRAVARREAERAVNALEIPECECTGDPSALPDTVEVSGTLQVNKGG